MKIIKKFKKLLTDKKMMSSLIVTILLLSICTLTINVNANSYKKLEFSKHLQPQTSKLLIHNRNEWHVNPGESIQQAIDSALPHDTIYVHDDNGNSYVYEENIKVNKQNLILIGDSANTVIVNALDPEDHTFKLINDGIIMSEFTVKGSLSCGFGGICLNHVNNCKIFNCNCRENLCAGIFLKHSNYCEINDNIISDNGCGGLKLTHSNYNTVTGNTIDDNTNFGISIYSESNNNIIYNNYFGYSSHIAKDTCNNIWNISIIDGTNIIGGPSIGGNYYLDYIGNDADNDGFGDESYNIDSGSSIDYLPLVEWTPQPILSFAPTSYDFGNMQEGQTDSTTFEIWNSGTGTLEYSLSEECEWINIDSTDGDSTDEHDVINVNIDTDGLSSGLYNCDISIASNDVSGVFSVTVNIEESLIPELSFSPISYDFGDKYEGQTDSTTFEIWNSGTGTLEYSLSAMCSSRWISINPTSGSSNGEHNIINIDIDTTGLSLGIHECDVSIASNGGNNIFTVTVNIIEETTPELSFAPTSYDFGNMQEGQTDSTTFEIWNSGTGTLEYSLSEECEWINVGTISSTSIGEHNIILVYIDTSNLNSGDYTCNVSITSNGGLGVFTITVNIEEHFILNLNKFPWYESNNPLQMYSGSAIAQMWLNYLWWNSSQDLNPPMLFNDQSYLYNYGQPHNYECNKELRQLDAHGLWYTVQNLDPDYNPYHYNFGIYKRDNVESALNDICHWLAYHAGRIAGYPVHVPVAVPTGGNYDNWMIIRGIHTSTNPWNTEEYEIYGFWINDPNTNGIGVNTYKTINEWVENYYFKLTDISTEDPCYNKWVSILEPPQNNIDISKKTIHIDSTYNKKTEFIEITNTIKKDRNLDTIIKNTINSILKEIVPYDTEFASIFAKTIICDPLLVNNDIGKDYYLIPFNIQDNIKQTLVVAIVDSNDGDFKEVSWVTNSVKYLSISSNEALKILSNKIDIQESSLTTMKLVYRNSCTNRYYPDWEITIDNNVFYVSQNGIVQ